MLEVSRSTITRFAMIFKWIRLSWVFFLLLNTLNVTDAARRIRDGKTVTEDQTFMVYLVKAPNSIRLYDEWLCGGALVSSSYILTSAACVEDVKYLYAVAGYNKYVPEKDIETNECTKATKRKVVHICVPINYELTYNNVQTWSYMDIALAKVDVMYDTNDTTFETLCSYKPSIIPVSFDTRFSEPGVDAYVYGWGHKSLWRLPNDRKNYNQKILQYAPVKLVDKERCKKEYSDDMESAIEQYMICSWGDEYESIVENGKPLKLEKLDGCKEVTTRTIHDILDEEDENPLVVDKTRRKGCLRGDEILNEALGGFCQNDHGGPLVTWVGNSKVVIGVASVFKVNDKTKTCTGPYLYSSTQCSSAFIDCHLSEVRRSICDSPPIKRGYDIFERHIIWDEPPIGAEQRTEPRIEPLVLANVQVDGRQSFFFMRAVNGTLPNLSDSISPNTLESVNIHEQPRKIVKKFWTSLRDHQRF